MNSSHESRVFVDSGHRDVNPAHWPFPNDRWDFIWALREEWRKSKQQTWRNRASGDDEGSEEIKSEKNDMCSMCLMSWSDKKGQNEE